MGFKVKVLDPENTYKIDTLYAWVSVDDNGNEGIMSVKIGAKNYPAVSGKLENINNMESWMQDAKKYTNKKIQLKKFTGGTVMRRL